jgi:spore germination protein
MNHRVRISEMQWTLIVASGFGELGLLTSPRDLAVSAGRSALWALLLAVGLALLFILLLVRLGRKFPGQSPIQYSRAIVGKPLAGVLGVALIAFHILLAAMCLRYYADLVNTVYLARTPTEITMLLLVGTAIYVVWHGVEPTARFIGFIYPLVLAQVMITVASTIFKANQTEAMIPPPPLDLPAIGSGAWRIAYAFIGVELSSMILPFVAQPKHPYRHAIMPVFINGALLFMVVLTALGVWGLDPVARLEYPGVAVLRVLRLPGLLVERWGSFVGMLWVMLMLCYLCAHFLALTLATAQAFHVEPASTRYFLFPVGLMTYYLANWPAGPERFEAYIHNLLAPLGIVANLALVLLLGIAWVRKVGKQL